MTLVHNTGTPGAPGQICEYTVIAQRSGEVQFLLNVEGEPQTYSIAMPPEIARELIGFAGREITREEMEEKTAQHAQIADALKNLLSGKGGPGAVIAAAQGK